MMGEKLKKMGAERIDCFKKVKLRNEKNIEHLKVREIKTGLW